MIRALVWICETNRSGLPNGTGLGLTLARRVAEEHGGSVCLEESNREGTVFTLSLTKNRAFTLEGLQVESHQRFYDGVRCFSYRSGGL